MDIILNLLQQILEIVKNFDSSIIEFFQDLISKIG